MPPAADILDGPSIIANRAAGVAVGWHIVIATARALVLDARAAGGYE